MPADEAIEHLALLAGSGTDLLELRLRSNQEGRWSSRFFDGSASAEAGHLAAKLAFTHEVFVGVLPRIRPRGRRRDVIPRGRVVWVDLDTADATERAPSLSPTPSLVVGSGSSGHAHAYWVLSEPVPIDELERLNRAVAAACGGDPASCDAARVLRVAGTLSHKTRPPTDLPIIWRNPSVLDASELCRLADVPVGLPDGVKQQRVRKPTNHRTSAAQATKVDQLEALEPEKYVSALTGTTTGRSRKIACPFHEDRTPSLHVYESAEDGWFCFGCRRGGSIYDFAAALWHRPLRGPGFLQLRDDLLRELAPVLGAPVADGREAPAD